jgi:hypothetical protein
MSTHLIPELDRKGLREFAFTTGGIVAVLFGLLLPWIFERGFPFWPWLIAAVLLVWGTLAPATLRPVYRGWMRIGLAISKVTVPVIMFVIFVVVITPIGFVRRVFRADSIPKAPSRSVETYRVASKKAEPQDLERPF